MPWHPFVANKLYPRELVIAECEDRIYSGYVKNRASARWYLEHIVAADSDMLKFKPFGTQSFGRCPWNPDVWRTPSGEEIWTPQPLPPGLGK
ncbi:MAG TPA: hypothetical protein VIF81_05010 [Pyrinomonadaceae bacterium]|jgi:hypothetical protein